MEISMQTKLEAYWIAIILSVSTFLLPHSVSAASPQEEVAACSSALSDDPELAKIKGKVGLSGVAEQTFGMKTNKSYPTTAEKKVITLWVEKIHVCSAIVEKAIADGQFQPSMVPLIKGLYPKFEQRALQLYDKKISYGEFARARDEDQAAFLKDVADAKREIDQQQEQSRLQAQQEQQQQEQSQMLAQQERDRNAANEKAARCQTARQNAATFCNKGNQGVVVNIGPNTYQNPNQGTVMDSYNCGYWGSRVTQDCR